MSFGSKRLDRAYDRYVTQTPEDYYGTKHCPECGEVVHDEETECRECGHKLEEDEEE
jgi:transposase